MVVVCHLRLMVVRLAPFQSSLIECDDDLDDPDINPIATRENLWSHRGFGRQSLHFSSCESPHLSRQQQNATECHRLWSRYSS